MGEREGEKHQCVVVSRAPSTGDLAHNPGMCPDWGIEPETPCFTGHAQSTEPHQPGLNLCFFFPCLCSAGPGSWD